MIKILTGDCLQILPKLPTASVDLVLSDLPYGQTRNVWDRIIPIEPMWREVRRVAKPAAAVVFMAAQPFASRLVCGNTDDFRYDLIWRKNKPTGFLNAKRQPLRAHEHLLVFYRLPPFYNPQKTQGHEPGHKTQRAKKSTNYGAYESTFYGGNTDRYPTSVLSIPVINNDDPTKEHPTQKPQLLMEWVIASYTKPGQIVLDIAAGSGTTGLAARALNRSALLIELNPAYVELSRRRLGLI